MYDGIVLPPDQGYKPKGWLDTFWSIMSFIPVFSSSMANKYERLAMRSMFYALDIFAESPTPENKPDFLENFTKASEYLKPICVFFRKKRYERVSFQTDSPFFK